jgi:hypothetical protein
LLEAFANELGRYRPTLVSVMDRSNDEFRSAVVAEFGLLRAEEVSTLAGSSDGNRRATASRWRRDRRILVVAHHGQPMYLGFQFDQATGRPRAEVTAALRALRERMDGWAIVAWWVNPNHLLGWRRPVDAAATDGGPVCEAAQREAAEWESEERVI